MIKQDLLPKVLFSATGGILIAAILVVFPGYNYLNLRPKMKLEPQLAAQLEAVQTLQPVLPNKQLTWHNTFQIREQLFWLSLAQQEIDCLPILLAAGCIGPLLLLFSQRRPATDAGRVSGQ